MNAETQVLDEGDVKVTTSRFIAKGQTFALRNITSVKLQNAGSLRWPIVWAIFAAGSMAGAQANRSGGGHPAVDHWHGRERRRVDGQRRTCPHASQSHYH